MQTKSETVPFTWNGWQFIFKRKYGKQRYFKVRHNPKVKNFIESVEITSEEFSLNATAYAKVMS